MKSSIEEQNSRFFCVLLFLFLHALDIFRVIYFEMQKEQTT